MKTAAVIAVGGLALLSAGGVMADNNKYCVTEARATDIIRLWGYELGETKLKNVMVRDRSLVQTQQSVACRVFLC